MAAVVYLSCLFLAAVVGAQVCSDASNQKCNVVQILSTFDMSHLVASTSEASQGKCTYLIRLSPGIVDGRVNFSLVTRAEDGRDETQDTEFVMLTDTSDLIKVTFASDPSTTFDVLVPYADYSSCFVTDFSNDVIGCRLWMYDDAPPEATEACKEGHANACGGTVHDTYNSELCASGPAGSR